VYPSLPEPATTERGTASHSRRTGLSPTRFLLLATLFLLTHALLRLAASSTIGVDEDEQLVFAQVLAAGYNSNQPPLYTWLVWASTRVLGVNAYATVAIKYGLFLWLSASVFQISRRLLPEPVLPLLAVCALLLMPGFAWNAHHGFTHTMLITALSSAAFAAMLRIMDYGRWLDYGLLGVWLGLGLLAKYNFPFIATALLATAVAVPELRRRLADRRLLLTLGIAGLLVLPHALWLLQGGEHIAQVVAAEVRRDDASYLSGLGSGLGHLAQSLAEALTPLWVVLLAVFPQAWRPVRNRGPRPLGVRLPGAFLASAAALVLLALLSGVMTYFRSRWLIPMVVLLPVYFFARVEWLGYGPRQVRRYLIIVALVTGLILCIRAAELYLGPSLQHYSKLHVPFTLVGRQLETAGFHRGTIVAGHNFIAGNLRVAFPDSLVLSANYRNRVPGRSDADGQCLLVWRSDQGASLPASLGQFVADRFGTAPHPAEPGIELSVPMDSQDRRSYKLRYVLYPQGLGRCH
jgi:4-amino-4-deoxy-L-arabinose transferase-like glycosyltransferase